MSYAVRGVGQNGFQLDEFLPTFVVRPLLSLHRSMIRG